MGSAAETAARLAAGGRVHALAQRYRRPVARGLRALREEMPEALEAEKRDAVKFPSGIENQKPRAVITVRGSFFACFYGFLYGHGSGF